MWRECRFPCGYDGAAGYLSGSLSNQPQGLEAFLEMDVGSKYVFTAIPDRNFLYLDFCPIRVPFCTDLLYSVN